MDIEAFFKPLAYVTAKVTHGCNLRCKYCKVDSSPAKIDAMSLETAKRAAQLLIENSEFNNLSFNMHGGEPMLMPDEWLEEVVDFSKALAAKHGKTMQFPVSTNGTLLTEERLLRLHAKGLLFSMSMDGPPEIHDIMRQRGADVHATQRLFAKHGIRVGIMAVISVGNYDKMTQVMDWYRKIGVRSFLSNFIEAQGRGVEENLLTAEHMFTAAKQIIEHMEATDISVMNDDLLRKVAWFVEGRRNLEALCCFNMECHAGRRMVAVDHDGSITVCGSADTSDYLLGHIDENIDEASWNAVLNRFHDKGQWIIRCFDCKASQICSHGCTTACNRSLRYKEESCRYTRMLWNYFCENPQLPGRIFMVAGQKRDLFM